MGKPLHAIDWALVQAFLAVAESGSLSAAARTLGRSQPTLGRQIRTVEGQLKAELFVRQPRGLVLTETGSALVAPAKAMQEAAQQIALTAAGQQDSLEGTVRITASAMISVYHLPAILADLRRMEPKIAVELVPSDESRNLLFREADIAVRMYRPTQQALVTRHIGDLEIGMFAAETYLSQRGVPHCPEDLMSHDFVGYDANPDIVDGFTAMGFPVDREFFKTRCDDNVTYWELLRAGCGIGFAQATIGRADPGIVEIDMGLPLPTLPIWLTAHEAMRQTPRIRRIWELLVTRLRPLTMRQT